MTISKVAFLAALSLFPLAATADSDWLGFYGGLSYATVSGEINASSTVNVGVTLEDSSAPGLFAGYNWQQGNFVYGGELNYTNVETNYTGFPTAVQDPVVELRARVGYALTEDLLAYGFFGVSRSGITEGSNQVDQNGTAYGIGADFMVTDDIFSGFEVSRRDVSGTFISSTLSTDIDIVALRVGYRF